MGERSGIKEPQDRVMFEGHPDTFSYAQHLEDFCLLPCMDHERTLVGQVVGVQYMHGVTNGTPHGVLNGYHGGHRKVLLVLRHDNHVIVVPVPLTIYM